jgi:hypothetical protein
MGLCTDGEVSSEKGEDAQDRKAQQVTHGGVFFYHPTASRRVMLVTGRGSFAASGLLFQELDLWESFLLLCSLLLRRYPCPTLTLTPDDDIVEGR